MPCPNGLEPFSRKRLKHFHGFFNLKGHITVTDGSRSSRPQEETEGETSAFCFQVLLVTVREGIPQWTKEGVTSEPGLISKSTHSQGCVGFSKASRISRTLNSSPYGQIMEGGITHKLR
jgi:hypothetical protein